MSIAQRVRDARRRCDEACVRAGRDPSEVLLVAAAKMNPASAVREAIAAGVDAVGENRVQEMVKKWEQGAYEGAPLHFIGHLQSNKVRQVVGRVDLIQSVHSWELLTLIDECAKKMNIRQEVLLEVNIGGETSKSGFTPDACCRAFEEGQTLENVRIRGLMAIPPPAEPGGKRYFMLMRQLYIDIQGRLSHNGVVDILSMGMSGDFEFAIEAGATQVRLGTVLFGER